MLVGTKIPETGRGGGAITYATLRQHDCGQPGLVCRLDQYSCAAMSRNRNLAEDVTAWQVTTDDNANRSPQPRYSVYFHCATEWAKAYFEWKHFFLRNSNRSGFVFNRISVRLCQLSLGKDVSEGRFCIFWDSFFFFTLRHSPEIIVMVCWT